MQQAALDEQQYNESKGALLRAVWALGPESAEKVSLDVSAEPWTLIVEK